MNKLKMVMDMDGIETQPPQPGEKDAPKPSTQEIVSNVVKNIMFSYARGQNGLNGTERKQYHRVSEMLDKATKDKLEVLELDDQDAGFLKKCNRECKMLPSDALHRVEELIEAMVKI